MDELKMSSTEGPGGSLDLGFPMAAQWNYMNISSHVPLDGLQMNANLVRCRMPFTECEIENCHCLYYY